MQIQIIEEVFGVLAFDRAKKPAVLTDILYVYAFIEHIN
jgi:hypothetical protein